MKRFEPIVLQPAPENEINQEPVQLFDDLYFVGTKTVGSWILTTEEGLVLIDAGTRADHWEDCLKPGLEKLGLAGERILAILLTHGHFDHYAGCDHIQRITDCEICLSEVDTVYIGAAVENREPNAEIPIPQVTKIIQPGEDLVFGGRTIHVLEGRGHTPGCLNYSSVVHDHGEAHRFLMVGGYGIFGPGNFLGLEYPFGVGGAVANAMTMAASLLKAWEYTKKMHCDIFFNPHPQLCRMYETAALNRDRKEGEPNAFVIGEDGVRQWLLERYHACMDLALTYSDIAKPCGETETSAVPNDIPANADAFVNQEPVKVFDDLYFVGNKIVGSWVIPTTEGLVLIEASGEADHYENCLKPGLKKLGLDQEPIRALLLTHGHFDHYGGADPIRRATGCDICLSAPDIVYMTAGAENRRFNRHLPIPEINRVVVPGEDLVFGDKVIHVMDGAGHTPGCLNYSMEVHKDGERHRFLMIGGFGIFGPGNFMGEEYPYGVDCAVDGALIFAANCVKAWEYAKETHCDVFLNPHPQLCDLYKQEAEDKMVVGEEGVRRWLLERYNACIEKATQYSDLLSPWCQ